MAKLNERIRDLRIKNDLTQDDLAEALGLSRSTIAGYETEKRAPDKDTLDKLASFFDTSIDYLLARTDEPRSADKIKEAISNEPELLAFWDKLLERPDLQLLFKQTKDMSPEGVKQIIRVIKAIEKEEEK